MSPTHEHRWHVFAGPFVQRQTSSEVRYHSNRAIYCVGCHCGQRREASYIERGPWSRAKALQACEGMGASCDSTNPQNWRQHDDARPNRAAQRA